MTLVGSRTRDDNSGHRCTTRPSPHREPLDCCHRGAIMITSIMRTWRVRTPAAIGTSPLEFVTADITEPGDSELLIAVRACGVCRTDLHVVEGDLPVHHPHVTPGHEVVGEVVAVGDRTSGEFDVGDRVGVAWLRHTCGKCHFCVRGAENLCPQSRYTGWDADGGYAEFITAPADYVHRLPAGYSGLRWR